MFGGAVQYSPGKTAGVLSPIIHATLRQQKHTVGAQVLSENVPVTNQSAAKLANMFSLGRMIILAFYSINKILFLHKATFTK